MHTRPAGQAGLRPGSVSRRIPLTPSVEHAQLMSNEMLIMPTRTRRIDGLTIRYTEIDAADGPVILLTRMWPEAVVPCRRLWPALASGARLVAIGLPGFGHSQGRTALFRPGALAASLHRLVGE